MLRYNFGFADLAATSMPKTNDPSYWCTLELSPGNYATLDPNKENSYVDINGNNVGSIRYDKGNCFFVGLSNDPTLLISSYDQVASAIPDYVTSFSSVFGESIILTIVVTAKDTPANSITGVAPTYDLARLVCDTGVSSIYATYVGGVSASTLVGTQFKAFRLVLRPLDYLPLLNGNSLSLYFQDSNGFPVTWGNINLAGNSTSTPPMLFVAPLATPIAGFLSGNTNGNSAPYPVVMPSINFTPAATPQSWKKPLPDGSVQNIGTSYDTGSVTASGTRSNSLSTLVQFTNTDIATPIYTITSIVATLKTSVAGLTAAAKTSVVGDFTINVAGTNFTGTMPAFSPTTLTSTLTTTGLFINPLDSFNLTMAYAPAVKMPVVGTLLSNYSTYITTTVAGFNTVVLAQAASGATNRMRKVSVQVFGYSSTSGNTTPVALGSPFVLSGSIV